MFDAWRQSKDLSDEARKALYADEARDRVPPGTFRWLTREFEKTTAFTNGVGATIQAHYREG